MKSESESLPPQSVSQVTMDDSEFEEYVVTQEEEPAAESPQPEVAAPEADKPVIEKAVVADEVEVEQDDTLVVIEDGMTDDSVQEMTLVETARAEQQRRNESQKAQIVINDKNLGDYAIGQLTIGESPEIAITNESLEAAEGDVELARDEAYWSERGYAIRLAWKEAFEKVEELEGDVFNFRMRFYAEDDPFFRDSQIKPAWDHAIEQLNSAGEEVELRKQELEVFKEEGRVAGALPGWLRLGIELEPEELVEEGLSVTEPGEPGVMDEAIGDPSIAPDPSGRDS